MVVTPSAMIELGTQIPAFSLPDANEKPWSPPSDTATLVIFMCNHCPYVIYVAELLETVHGICDKYDIAMCGINSNDITTHPDDSPEKMLEASDNYGWTFPYLFDETQNSAASYGAECTPDFFLFDESRELVYRGQFDDSRPGNDVSVTGKDLQAAIDALLNDAPPLEPQLPSVGCNIKWKPGNEPRAAT